MKLILISVGLLLSVQANATPIFRQLTEGLYDGGGTNITVTAQTVQIETGCSHGHFDRPTLNGNGTFFVDGFMQSEMMTMPPPPEKKVRFEGLVSRDGKQMKLTIVEGGSKNTELSFKKAAQLPHLMKCR